MLKHYKYLISLAMISGYGWTVVPAQAQRTEIISGAMGLASGAIKSSTGDSLFLGPGTYQIEGTWEIYSKSIWISPAAVITGSGQMVFHNPSVAGHTNSPTYIDANNIAGAINVPLVIANSQNVILADGLAPAGSGWTDNTGNADLVIGNSLTFAAAGGDVLLGNANLILLTEATFTWNAIANSAAYVVTNGNGKLVKSGIATSSTFTFPVGQAEADYTPATLTNNAGLRDISLQVTTFANSAAVVNTPAEGVNRIWQITSNQAGPAAICLSHNSVTNAAGSSTDGASFDNTNAFVTQQSGTGTWSAGSPASGGSPVSTLCAIYNLATTTTDPAAFFSKTSDLSSPLPIILNRFTVKEKDCRAILEWSTSNENNLIRFDVQYSFNGKDFITAGSLNSRHQPSSYIYELEQPLDKAYYRLNMHSTGIIMASPVLPLFIRCDQDKGIVVFPNPTTNELQVRTDNNMSQVQLYDQFGRIVYRRPAANKEERIDLSPYASGVYHVMISDVSNNTYKIQVVKK